MLRRWVVGALGSWALRTVREHFASGAYLVFYLSDCLQILHTTPIGGLVVPFEVYELCPSFWFSTNLIELNMDDNLPLFTLIGLISGKLC